MIYCVVPPVLADELYDRLVEYYRDDPQVTVIVDRRGGEAGEPGPRSVDGDRRRRRVPGTFPPIEPTA